MAASSGYSPSEFSSMQQDAIRRVREMQRRARQRVMETNGQLSPSPPIPVPAPEPVKKPAPPAAVLPFQGILKKISTDGDSALILILLLLLLNEGADRTLILALVYILVT